MCMSGASAWRRYTSLLVAINKRGPHNRNAFVSVRTHYVQAAGIIYYHYANTCVCKNNGSNNNVL